MAEIGYGYGSEYQLLRFLGHHRNEFEGIIRENTHLKGDFSWLDFPYNDNMISMDGEYTGISFLNKRDDYNTLKEKWADFWPQGGNTHNWDAIFIHDNEYILVEAKANLEEMKSNIYSKAAESSKNKILKTFEETQEFFDAQTGNDWTKKYYQLANRLAFIKFLTDNGIRASLLYVYFINGYTKRHVHHKKVIIEDKSVKLENEWKSAINEQYDYLGISESKIQPYLSSVFINCKK